MNDENKISIVPKVRNITFEGLTINCEDQGKRINSKFHARFEIIGTDYFIEVRGEYDSWNGVDFSHAPIYLVKKKIVQAEVFERV